MYEPNKQEALLMKALKDLSYQVWWDGYKIVSNADSYTQSTAEILINKGWKREENNNG